MVKNMISIIIPVYNSIPRLQACLESVVHQEYDPVEVIIVDDCSSDGSLELCREYERQYEFVQVITKPNEGVSAARNLGLARAKGEYVQFVDSDDQLYPTACRSLVKRMERDQSDLVIGGYYNQKERREVLPSDLVLSGREEIRTQFPALFTHFLIHVPWNKLYRRSVLQRAEAQFPTDLSKGEDLMFNLRVLEQVKSLSLLSEPMYDYNNLNDQSLSFRFREDAMEIEERLYYGVKKFWMLMRGGEPDFLFSFYLTALKNKYYALMGQSGFGKKKCKQYMKQWEQMESVRELYDKCQNFGLKDRILLFCMKHHMTEIVYQYYKLAGK